MSWRTRRNSKKQDSSMMTTPPYLPETVVSWIEQGAEWRAAASDNEVAQLVNVSYGEQFHRQKLDFYFSPGYFDDGSASLDDDDDNNKTSCDSADGNGNNNQQTLIVIHFHGGGWSRGAKDQSFYGAPSMARAAVLCGRKCLAVTPNYRRGAYPTFLHDAANAIQWVYQNVGALGGGTSQQLRIVLSGHSAGSHIVSLLMLQYQKYLPNVPVETIHGLILVSGVYDLVSPLLDQQQESNSILHVLKNKWFELAYVWPAFGLDETLRRQASPLWLLEQQQQQQQAGDKQEATSEVTINTENLPPVLMLNASMDMGLEAHGLRMSQLVQEHTDVLYKVVPKTNHATICWSADEEIKNFLQQQN